MNQDKLEITNEKNEFGTVQPAEIPADFVKFGISLPPMLLAMACAAEEMTTARFIGLNYYGSKATWHDGRASRTFSYYAVYRPFIEHPAVIYVKGGANCGADDAPPTHTILIDRAEQVMYLAGHDEACRFLDAQHPKREVREIDAVNLEEFIKGFREIKMPVAEMQSLGMFEFLMPASPDTRNKSAQLVAWMDENTPAEVTDFFKHLGDRK